jgi:acetyltransferase-like isoleucine patch superfamily enzyme
MMKVFTQDEFDSFPVVNGVRYCPTGDYSLVKVDRTCHFGKHSRFADGLWFEYGCSFGSNCRFGEQCVFDIACDFGKNCSFGDRCQFGYSCAFGHGCTFGDECTFKSTCNFGALNRFGKNCSFNGRRALPGYPLLALAGAGSANRTVYAFNVEGGPWIEAGCFLGDLDAFRKKARADGDKLKCLQYLGFANIVAATWCPERVE